MIKIIHHAFWLRASIFAGSVLLCTQVSAATDPLAIYYPNLYPASQVLGVTDIAPVADLKVDDLGGEIQVTEPNSSSSWELEHTYNITWSTLTMKPTTDTVQLSLIKPGGVPPYVIAKEVPNTGEYEWTIPADLPEAYLNLVQVTVQFLDTAKGGVSEVFTIASTSVLAPQAGEVLQQGQSYQFKWLNRRSLQQFHLFLQSPTIQHHIVMGLSANETGCSDGGICTYSWTPDISGSDFSFVVNDAITGTPSISGTFTITPAGNGGRRLNSIIAPQSGYYAFKMNWYRSTASSSFFLSNNSWGVIGEAGSTELRTIVPVSDIKQDRYLLYRNTSHGASLVSEVIDVDWQASSGTRLVLRSPLQNSYREGDTAGLISRYLGGYWGYCPVVSSQMHDIGQFNLGDEIDIGYITNYYNELIGPKESVSYGDGPDYFYITKINDSTFRVWFDEGKHIGWTSRDNRLGYNDGSFDIVYVGQSAAVNEPMPLPVHSASGPEYCGTENVTVRHPVNPSERPLPATDVTDIKNDAAKLIERRIQQQPSNIDAARANEILARAESILAKIKALQGELESLKPALAAIKDFIAFGTPTTSKLGEGERAGVVASFTETFGKAPASEAEWEDVIKIANGRWPSLRNEKREQQAEAKFEQIYKRKAHRNLSKYDDAAVVIMAYGLRPASRNMESEAAAIKSFKAIYKKVPKTAADWDTVRAIAYSGASRELKQTTTAVDTDHDGLSDADEPKYGTDPKKADTDDDGYDDATEIKNGYNPLGSGRFNI